MEKRNEILSFVQHWNHRSSITTKQITQWLGLNRSRYYDWKNRKDTPNKHNGKIPKSHWLMESEKAAIIDFAGKHLKAGYRRMSYLMLDKNVVAVSPSSTYRVLEQAGLIQKWERRSSKGTGFDQPTASHQHWHIDFSYIRVKDVFYFLVTVLDGYSRAVLSWDLKPHMTQEDAQIVVQKAREKHLGAKPRIISDNGAQFTSKDFKAFVNICDMTHVTTAPYYPQSNGKIERWHRSLKHEGIRPKTPLDQEDAKRIIGRYITDYNEVRLHSAISYVPPIMMLNGTAESLQTQRREKLSAAIQRRKKGLTSQEEKTFSLKEENDTTLSVS